MFSKYLSTADKSLTTDLTIRTTIAVAINKQAMTVAPSIPDATVDNLETNSLGDANSKNTTFVI